MKVSSLVSEKNHRGFCVGVLKEPYANAPEDTVKVCFIENDWWHDSFLVTPPEALSLASLLAWAYSEHAKVILQKLE